jgi:hypothetical protein
MCYDFLQCRQQSPVKRVKLTTREKSQIDLVGWVLNTWDSVFLWAPGGDEGEIGGSRREQLDGNVAEEQDDGEALAQPGEPGKEASLLHYRINHTPISRDTQAERDGEVARLRTAAVSEAALIVAAAIFVPSPAPTVADCGSGGDLSGRGAGPLVAATVPPSVIGGDGTSESVIGAAATIPPSEEVVEKEASSTPWVLWVRFTASRRLLLVRRARHTTQSGPVQYWTKI